MQTDELRAELAELAREVDPFPQELTAIRKRVARRRAASMSVAAVLIVGLIAGVVATTRSGGNHVQVAGRPKSVSIKALPRIDALVALRTSADIAKVRGILESTDVVEQYATVPSEAFRRTSLGEYQLREYPNLESFAQAYGGALILGVELDRSVADSMEQLRTAIGYAANVTEYASLKGRADYDDVEIFMAVKACQGQIDAVRLALARDSDVESYRFLSKNDSFKEFRKLFQDEPVLIGNTTADDLPASFRVRLHDGVVPPAFASRYIRIAGVRAINAAANPFGEMPSIPENDDQSACTPNP